ncbi:cytochrome P450 2F3 isoform X2 [Parasteatoda tepidariorum]|nr:cytochrome P450 2F3 [Parasteatoda tepidariorum]
MEWLNIFNEAPVAIALILVFASTAVYYILVNRGLPPGPLGLPLLGYWPLLKNDTCHLQLQELQKKYGDLFSFSYAGALYLNLGSIHAVREFHIAKADCFERVKDYSLLNLYFKNGVAFLNGEPWKILRKFTMQQMKELGMSTVKESMEGPLYESIQETLEFLKCKEGDPVDIIQMLSNKCNAILRRCLFRDSCITEEEVTEINASYAIVMGFTSVKNTLHAGNLARYLILPFKSGYGEAMKHHKRMRNNLMEIVKRHKNTFDPKHPRNFVDAYLKERVDRQAKGDPTAQYFTDEALAATLDQIVGDGVLGVSSFAATFLKYVIDFEDEQEKMYKELMEEIGEGRDPTLEDKLRLPYTSALMQEILRISNFFPMFPSQQCIKECTVRGYRIPKGAITLMNTWCCHSNPDVYEEPEKFKPTRFLPKEGKPKPEPPLTFGVGKRSCIGESFTMTQTFLFLVSLVKHFKLTLPPGSSDMTAFELLMKGTMEMCAHLRN